ncbi:uncharacterized protein LOC131245971 isoform X2 [Magnolia sinica]|uniref:uncharacterized protein LOC131245971 isoform X2 n=1 Tax=Magnolia sinica TaxID=86752 RepID=UPI0026594D44|nr:uncharacterized protein LOC131245971 isoform X2 [Magnolia sinica]
MEINCLMNSFYPKSNSFRRRIGNRNSFWAWNHQEATVINCLNKASAKIDCGHCGMKLERPLEMSSVTPHQNSFIAKASESTEQLIDDPVKEKKGTVVGAVALIIGTTIGSGILALPKKTSPAGFIPSATCMIVCWGFHLIEALLLAEINVGLRNNKKRQGEDGPVEIISIRTMAQETLGQWAGTLATITYIFLAYTSLVAYTSKSGEILSHLINLPISVSGVFFTLFFTLLISVGGTHLTDRINQWLTAFMIGLLVVIEVIAALSGGWSGLSSTADWARVPATVPVIIFSLVYHDLAPVICTYLGGDLTRIRVSVVLGSLVPLVALLVWDAVALGLSQSADGIDPVDLLMRVEWHGVSAMVEGFSLLAVGTSLIGTMLGFSQFFEEHLTNLSLPSPSTESLQGGYCMTMLFGVLPPAMAWAMHSKSCHGSNSNGGEDGRKVLSAAKPVLLAVGLFACGIVMEQILQDLSVLHS